jgi:ABC-type phosphate transport system permease subunit
MSIAAAIIQNAETSRKHKIAEKLILSILFLCALAAVLTIIGIVFSLAFETFRFFRWACYGLSVRP